MTQVAEEGFEQGAETTGEMALSETGGAKSDAIGARSDLCDAELRTIIERWPDLADAIKAGILAMVRSADQ